jgi:hypothetical protein
VAIPQQDREHSQWQFGHPVTFSDQPPPRPPAPTAGVTNRVGGPPDERLRE